jgi:hypothetical protein
MYESVTLWQFCAMERKMEGQKDKKKKKKRREKGKRRSRLETQAGIMT